MKHLLFTFLAIAITATCPAQESKYIIKGTLFDSSLHEPIQAASVSVTANRDTAVRLSTLSSPNGNFEISVADSGAYVLDVSYQNEKLLIKAFSVAPNETVINLGIIQVRKNEQVLPEVIIKDVSPVTLKGDTISYKANAYKTRPDASVEDLLRKLPGLQVDQSGTVKAQGQPVQKVYVDGKEFFGDNPSMATKNLTADMIEQVQVFGDAGEQAKFSGIDDGSRIKAINLKLKKDKKKGLFGNASAGYGTRNRYQAGFSANYFNGASQVSLIAGASNFASSATGLAGQTSATGTNPLLPQSIGTGLNESSSAGINYHNFFGKNLDLIASYQLLQDRNENERSRLRQTFLQEETLLTNGTSVFNTKNDAQRLNLKVTYSPDSFNTIMLIPSFRLQNTSASYEETLENFARKATTSDKIAESQTASQSNAKPVDWMNQLVWRRRFGIPGRTFSAAVTQTINQNNMAAYSGIRSTIVRPGDTANLQANKDYLTQNNLDNKNYTVALSYTEPVGRGKIVEINYGFARQNSQSSRKTFQYDPATLSYSRFDDSLTNDFRQANRWNRVGVNFKRFSKDLTYQVGMTVQQLLFRTNDESKNALLSHRFTNLLPIASISYQFRSGRSLQVQYRGRANQPDIRQLQNVTDILSYPYIQKGNPGLKQEFVHTANISYNAFNSTTFRSFFAYVTYSKIQNKITSSIQQNAVEQIWVPANLQGAYNLNGNFGLGIPFKSCAGAALNTSTQIDFYRNVSLVNGAKNFTNDLNLSQDVQLTYNPGGDLDVGLNANVTYNTSTYSIQENQNTSYFSHALSLNVSCSVNPGVSFATNINYMSFNGRGEGLNQHALLWNAAFGKKLFRGKGEIRFSAHDILNRNISFNRYRSDNFVEDSRNLTLKRFFMLTFIYRLNKIGSK